MRTALLLAPGAAPDYGRHLPVVVLGLGVIPSLWVAWLLWLAPLDDLTADRTALAARDFTALWTAGRLAGEQAFTTLFDPAGFTAYLRSLFGPGMPFQIWPYPPVVLPLARVFAMPSLGASFVLYSVLGMLALFLMLRNNGFPTWKIAAVLLSPAVATNALVGQNGTLIAVLLVGGLLTLRRHPVVAGALFGALIIKPQFALLLPIVMLASSWKAVLASCMSAMILAILSVCAFGFEPWVEFVARNRTVVADYVATPWQATPAQSIFSSVFMATRSMGANLTLSYAAQSIVSVACAYAVWTLWFRTMAIPERHRVAATIALVLLAAPWVHAYDMPALAIAIVLLYRDFRGVQRSMLGFAWLWPGLSPLVEVPPAIMVLSVASVAWLAIGAAASSSRPLPA